eukprot:gene8267-7596_t
MAAVSLTNGLITRTFVISPNFATVGFDSHMEPFAANTSLLRAVNPEARITLGGHVYDVGGLIYETVTRAYLNKTQLYGTAKADPAAFTYVGHTTSAPEAPFPWTIGSRNSFSDYQWPPAGLHLTVTYKAPQ